LKDGITLMDTGVLWKLRKLRNPLGLIKIDIPFNPVDKEEDQRYITL